jgi:hypothetical protein
LCQFIPNQDAANLLDLLRFRQGSSRLEIENLNHTITGENMVASSEALSESKAAEQIAQLAEPDVRIGGTAQHSDQDRLRHLLIIS